MSERSGERLKRAMQNLKADTAFRDRYANAATLEDRMARTHTPALSIAVIDDFKLAGVEAFGVHEAGVSDIAGKNSLFSQARSANRFSQRQLCCCYSRVSLISMKTLMNI